MADNTTINSMSGGDVIATDDIGGVKHQQIKIEYGADGTATPVSDTNRLPTASSGIINLVYGTPPTLTSGQQYPAMSDAYGNLLTNHAMANAGENLDQDVQGFMPKPTVSADYSPLAGFAYANDVDISVKPSAGHIKSIIGTNSNASKRFIHVFNKITAPTSGDTPVFVFSMTGGGVNDPGTHEVGANFFGEGGYLLASGIALGVSISGNVFSPATITDHSLNWTFI